MSHQIMRLNYLFKISWLQINEPKCREYRNTFKEINLEVLITIRIKDEQRPSSLEI